MRRPEVVDAAFAEMDERSVNWFISQLTWKLSPLKTRINDFVFNLVHFVPFPQRIPDRYPLPLRWGGWAHARQRQSQSSKMCAARVNPVEKTRNTR